MAREIDIIAFDIFTKFDEWKIARETKQQRWMDFTRIARLQEDPADKTDAKERSTLKMPTTKNAITMAVDNLYQMLFDAFVFFDIEGRTPDDDPELLKFYLQYLLDKDGFKRKMKQFLYDVCCYGTGICQVGLKTVTEKRLVQKGKDRGGMLRRFRNKFITPARESKEKVTLDQVDVNRPTFTWISIFDFFIEPQALSIEEATGIIVRKQLKYHVLLQMQAAGIISGVEEIPGALAVDKKDTTDDEIQTGGMDPDRQRRLMKSGLVADLKDGDVSLLEYWGWLGADLLKDAGFKGKIENGGAEVKALIANGNVVLQLIENPFLTGERHFLKETFEEVNGEFYGLGICEIAEGPQRALDATVRSRIDNKRIAINQIFGIDITRLSDLNEGGMYAGKTFFTEGNPSEIIKQLPIVDVTGGSYIEAQEFERYIHEATGISPIVGGISSPKTQTATEVSIQRSQSSIRLRMIALQIEENVMEPVLRKFYQIVLQFFNEDELIKVTDASAGEIVELREVTQSGIIGDYDFVPQGVLSITAKAQFVKIMDFLTRTANQFDVGVTDRPLLLRKAYAALGFNDGEQVFKRDQKVGQEMLKRAQGSKGVGSPPGATSEGLRLIGQQGSEQGSELG